MARRPAARAGWMAGCASFMRARCCEHVSKRMLRKQLEAVARGARDQHGGAPCGRPRPARPRAPRRRRPPRAPRPARRTARPPARAQRGALTSPWMSLSCKSLRACVFHALIRHRRVRQRRTQRARQRRRAPGSMASRAQRSALWPGACREPPPAAAAADVHIGYGHTKTQISMAEEAKHSCGGVRQRAPCAAGPTPAARGRPQRRRLRSRTRGRPRRPPGPPPARSRRCRARPAQAVRRPRRPRGPPRGAPQRSPGGSASRVSPQMPRCVCQDGHSIAALLRQPATSGSWAAWQRPVPALMELHILCFPLSRAAHAALGAHLRHTAQPRLAAGRGRARACRASACVCACSAASCCCSAAAAPCRRAASARAAASASRASASSACRRRGACASGSGRACAQCKRGRWPLPYR